MRILPVNNYNYQSKTQNNQQNVNFGMFYGSAQSAARKTSGNFVQRAMGWFGKKFQMLKTSLALKKAQRNANKKLRQAQRELDASEVLLRKVTALSNQRGQISQTELEALAQKAIDEHNRALRRLGVKYNFLRLSETSKRKD